MTNSCGKTTLLTGKRLHPSRGVSIIQTSNREIPHLLSANLKSSNIGQQSTDSSSSSKRSSPPTKCPSNCTEILPNWQCQCNDQLAIYSSRIGESFPKSAPKSSGAAFVDNKTFFQKLRRPSESWRPQQTNSSSSYYAAWRYTRYLYLYSLEPKILRKK